MSGRKLPGLESEFVIDPVPNELACTAGCLGMLLLPFLVWAPFQPAVWPIAAIIAGFLVFVLLGEAIQSQRLRKRARRIVVSGDSFKVLQHEVPIMTASFEDVLDIYMHQRGGGKQPAENDYVIALTGERELRIAVHGLRRRKQLVALFEDRTGKEFRYRPVQRD